MHGSPLPNMASVSSSDLTDTKAQRASARSRNLHLKRSTYDKRPGIAEGMQHMSMTASRGRNRVKPHRSARAVVRACLAKGAVESIADFPSIDMGRGGRFTQWSRKPAVSPLLARHQLDADADTELFMRLWTGPLDMPDEVVRGEKAASEEAGYHPRERAHTLRDFLPDDLVFAGPVVEPQLSCDHPQGMLAVISSASRCVLVEDTLRHLENSCCSSDDSVANTFAAGGVPILLKAMETHCNSEMVQARASRVLSRVITHSSDCRAQVATCGGVKAVLAAMVMHQLSGPVQDAGCWVLKELAARSPAIQDEIATSSGIEAVLHAMESHSSNARIQAVACGVLRNMSVGHPRYQSYIASLGGVRLVLNAMATHRSEVTVQWACLWALFCLAVQNQSVQAEAVALGGLHSVVAAMSAHSGASHVQEAGCWVLKELAAVNVSKIASWFDCVHAVFLAVKQHLGKDVQDVGQVTLRRLATCEAASGFSNVISQSRPVAERSQVSTPTSRKRRFDQKRGLPTIRE